MTTRSETLASRISARFGERVKMLPALNGEVACEVAAPDLVEVCRTLRDDPELGFEQMIDLAVVDYLHYGLDEWATAESTSTGFSRGVQRTFEAPPAQQVPGRPGRFAAVYQLLSVSNNWRLRLRCYASDSEPPMRVRSTS